MTKLKVIAGIALVLIGLASHAHQPQRPRIGAPNQQTPTGAPENWGTYCVTELAPLFREALALYNKESILIAKPYGANFYEALPKLTAQSESVVLPRV